MKFCFRVDASLDIGSGHVIRCLTVADALSKKGHQSYFICRLHEGNLIESIRERGYMVYVLSQPSAEMACKLIGYQQWLGVNEQQDAEETLIILTEYAVNRIVVDHYALSAEWQIMIRQKVDHITVIDDLANRPHDADIILDCGLEYLEQDYIKLNARPAYYLLGSRYALLRPEFRIKRLWLERHPKNYDSEKLRILLNLGGIDKDDLTSTILELLSHSVHAPNLEITVVMGITAPHKNKILKQTRSLPFYSTVLINTNNMADLIAEHDLGIGAAGSTAWERCCLGLPTIMICMAENQRMIAKHLHELGVVISLDQAEVGEKLLYSLQKINIMQLMQMHRRALTVTEGLGTDLLLQAMFPKELKPC